jgi:uncharacterized protein YpuA (DUF1002 family)
MRPAHLLSRPHGRRTALLFLVTLMLATAVSQVGVAAKTVKVITLGESLSDTQRKEMLDFFKATNDDKIVTITEKETDEAMKGIIDDVGQGVSGAYSSTALTCRNLGDGLDVTTRNISLITPSMYAMALVTAGIGDATLVVSGPFDSPALGTTAMAGVFNTWDLAPCQSGDTSKDRQRLALEQLALTADIGQALSTPGLFDGVQPAADVILETQKNIVTDKLKSQADIDAALLKQEQTRGIVIPADLRVKLVDLFVRLAKADIDWSTFSAGWTIKFDGSTKVTMKGDGIAIRHARQTATAEAAAAMTATAEAEAALTATAAAQMTATAEAAAAQATQDAIAALTATAAAQPTATPTPTPTATPSPFGVSGKVTDVHDDQLSVRQTGSAEPTQFTVDPDATISRGGQPAKLDAVKKGDSVTLTVDGNTNHVRVISATAAPVGLAGRIAGFWWLIPLGAVVPVVLFGKGRVGGGGDPFVVKRVMTA